MGVEIWKENKTKNKKKTNIFFGDGLVQNESPWEKNLDLYIEQIHLFHLVDGNIKEGFFFVYDKGSHEISKRNL